MVEPAELSCSIGLTASQKPGKGTHVMDINTLLHAGAHFDTASPALVLGGVILGAILLRAAWLSIWRGF